jgi:hypothetical protein
MVPEEGVEPTRPEGHTILSRARLPVPPLRDLLTDSSSKFPGGTTSVETSRRALGTSRAGLYQNGPSEINDIQHNYQIAQPRR